MEYRKHLHLYSLLHRAEQQWYNGATKRTARNDSVPGAGHLGDDPPICLYKLASMVEHIVHIDGGHRFEFYCDHQRVDRKVRLILYYRGTNIKNVLLRYVFSYGVTLWRQSVIFAVEITRRM